MIKVVLWDYDGVLMNSNDIRTHGFEQLLEEYPNWQVEELLDYHRRNGGLSRYVKFRYFFDIIRKEKVDDADIQKCADRFSKIMKKLLVNPTLLISETLSFIENNYQNYQMFVVSGSDQDELRYLCKKLGISRYFKGIYGSPTDKKEIVQQIMTKYFFNQKECLLIGDSINDYDAAIANNIYFFAYNNKDINHLSTINFQFTCCQSL